MRPTTPRRTVAALIATACVSAAALSAVAVAATSTRAIDNRSGEFTFNKKNLRAKQGTVVIRFTNRGGSSHNVAIKGRTIKTKRGRVVPPGRVSAVSAKLKPGRYTYFCSVPGHEQAGMKGTLVVIR